MSVFRFDTKARSNDAISLIANLLFPFHLTSSIHIIGAAGVKTDHCAGAEAIHAGDGFVLHGQTFGENDIIVFELSLALCGDPETLREERATGLLVTHRGRMSKFLETLPLNHAPHVVQWHVWGNNGRVSAPATFIFAGTDEIPIRAHNYKHPKDIVVNGSHIFIAAYDRERRPVYGDLVTFSTSSLLVDAPSTIPIPRNLKVPDGCSMDAPVFEIVSRGEHFRRRFVDLVALHRFASASGPKIKWIAPSGGRLLVVSTVRLVFLLLISDFDNRVIGRLGRRVECDTT